jgi:putative membrane protein
MYWHNGMDSGSWIVMMVFWLAIAGVIVAAAFRVFTARERREPGRERPEEILERRLASGEIDAQTYDELRSRLGGGALAGGQ